MGCQALVQGISPTRGSNPVSSTADKSLYHRSHQGSLKIKERRQNKTSGGSQPHSELQDQNLNFKTLPRHSRYRSGVGWLALTVKSRYFAFQQNASPSLQKASAQSWLLSLPPSQLRTFYAASLSIVLNCRTPARGKTLSSDATQPGSPGRIFSPNSYPPRQVWLSHSERFSPPPVFCHW